MAKEFYFEFPYGSLFYGKETPPGVVPQVQRFYVIREPNYYILKWTAPEYDASGNAVTPQAYVVYRTEHVNKLNYVELATITTLDVNGKVDTCYIDDTIDITKDYYYTIITVNEQGYPSVPVLWKTDYLLAGIDKYKSTGLYTSQKLNYFYSTLNTLTTFDVFDTQSNVIPVKNITKLQSGAYVPDNDYLYLDFFPGIATGTVLDVYLNSVHIASGINSSFFYVSLPYLPAKQTLTLEVKQSGSLLRQKTYTSYDYLIFPSAFASELNDNREDIEILKNNIWKDECSLDKIYQNFGSFFNFPQPKYFVTEDYKDTVVGNTTDKPGLVAAGLHGGSLLGIKEAIQSITGLTPHITYYRDKLGWVVRENKAQAIKKMCIIGMSPTNPIRTGILSGGYYPGTWGGLEIWGTNKAEYGESHTVNSSAQYVLSYTPVTYISPWSGSEADRITAYWYNLGVKQTLTETNVLPVSSGQFYVNYLTGAVTVPAALIGKTVYTDYYDNSTIVYWGGNGNDGGIGWPVAYSYPFKHFSLHIKVFGSVSTVTQERVVCSGYVDYLNGQNVLLTSPNPPYAPLTFAVIDELGNSYYSGVDFTLDANLGTITWNSPSPCPVNRVYYADYSFSYKSVVQNIVNQIKFPQERIVYQWL